MSRGLTNVSMLPLITPKDRVIISNTKNVFTGDIVAFTRNDRIIVHRVVYVNPNNKYVITRGDNNLISDGKVFRENILGTVNIIKRNGKNISIRNIYIEQSLFYTRTISLLCNNLTIAKIPYVLLKGLPVHLKYGGGIPNRVYSDCDILVSHKHKDRAEVIFRNSGFVLRGTEFLSRKSEGESQVNYVNYGSKFPVVVDLHFDISVGLTKVLGFEKLVPSTQKLTSYFLNNRKRDSIDNSIYYMLSGRAQLLYLLLHFFHHNYLEFHRLELISKVVKSSPDWSTLVKDINRLKIQNFVYPALLLLEKYYYHLPKKVYSKIKVRFWVKLISKLFLSNIDPSIRGVRVIESIKRYIYLLILSPVPLSTKIMIVFSRSAFKYYLETIIFLARSPLIKKS